MHKIIRASLLGLLALPMAAQDHSFGLGGSLILGHDSLKKATQNTMGFTVWGDYTGKVYGTTMPVRVGLGLTSMPGKEKNGLKTSLGSVQVYGDLLLETPWQALNGVLGLSINNYSMTKSGTEDTQHPDNVDRHFPVRDVKGLKLGLRLGLEYRFSDRLTLQVLLQQTELAGKDLQDPLVRVGGVNPAWTQVGLRYTF